MALYKQGDKVTVSLPSGEFAGEVKGTVKSFSDEIKYEIHGEEFVTITSARSIEMERCKGENTPYRDHLAGTYYCSISGSVENLELSDIRNYKESENLAIFNYCPYCGEKLTGET
jgi:hypothetical protein